MSDAAPPGQPDFDRVARPYRWMEYLTFGTFLERCRFALLDRLGDPHRALLLGDGDGRFLSQLLRKYPQLTAHVVDLSPAMLRLSQARVAAAGNAHRATFHRADLRDPLPVPSADDLTFDLVTAPFLLDCFTTEEIITLIHRVLPLLAHDAAFLVSDFALPAEQPFRFLGWLLVSALYKAFAVLTGLTVRQLPDYAGALEQAGFRLVEERLFLCGILRSELWRLV